MPPRIKVQTLVPSCTSGPGIEGQKSGSPPPGLKLASPPPPDSKSIQVYGIAFILDISSHFPPPSLPFNFWTVLVLDGEDL